MNQASHEKVSKPSPMGRHAYFWKSASKKSRMLYGVTVALGLFCILLLILSANKFVNGSVFKIPIVSTVTNLLGLDLSESAEDTVEKAQDSVDHALDALEIIFKDSELLADLEEQLDLPFDEWEATYGMQPAEFRKLFNPLSLSSLAELFTLLLGENHAAVFILRLLIGLVIGFAMLLILLAALATYFGKTWLSLLTCFFASGFFALTGGLGYWLLGCAALIAMGVICFSLTKEYKQYRKSFTATPSQ